MSAPSADRNLLFGILALQMDFITRDQLVAGMNAWVIEKTKPLGQILVEQGALDADNRAWLDAGVERHLAKHNNDPQQSLAALSPLSPLGRGAGGEGPSLRDQLHHLADPDLQASLAVIGRDKPHADPSATVSYMPAASDSKARFRVLRPHAEGGLGRVSVARDQELSREVALKEIKELYVNDTDSRTRFLREAEITGGLEHPGIVPVYSLGSYADGRPFYAMRFIRGESLWDAIKAFHRRSSTDFTDYTDKRNSGALKPVQSVKSVDLSGLEFRQLLGRFVDVCQAIQYAHDRGVLHRDLKPGNIMLGKYGETLVVDWGLAKARGVPERTPGTDALPLQPRPESDSATVPGKALGTPAFMSPEQAAGQHDQLGPTSDVYSLGATLYCLLTGRPPIDHADTGEMLRRARRGEFRPPREVNAGIDPGLEAICLKAMALEQRDRYTGVLELAQDVEHWLADEPVSAWPEPWVVKGRRWVARHRVLVTAAAAALLVGALSVAIAAVFLSKANEELQIANKAETEERKRKEQELLRAEWLLYARSLSVAQHAWKSNDAAAAWMALVSCREDFRGWEYDYLHTLLNSNQLTYWGKTIRPKGSANMVTSVAFSPDGKRILSGGLAQNTVWDAVTGFTVFTLEGAENSWIHCAMYSPNGKHIAGAQWAADTNDIHLWDASTGRKVNTLKGHKDTIDNIAFSPDSRWIVSASQDRTARLWDAITAQEHMIWTIDQGLFYRVAFTPNGNRVACCDPNYFRMWDMATRKELFKVDNTGDANGLRFTNGLAFSPNGKWMSTAGSDGNVYLWEANTANVIGTLRGHTGLVSSVVFSSDSQRLVSGSWDTTVKVWDLEKGQAINTLRGHRAPVTSVSVALDGLHIASGSTDGASKVWDATKLQEGLRLKDITHGVVSVAVSSDGKRLAGGTHDDKLGIWDLTSGDKTLSLNGGGRKVVAWHPDGKRIASGSGEWKKISDPTNGDSLLAVSVLKIWDASNGKEAAAFVGQNAYFNAIAISPDGQWIIADGDADEKRGSIRKWHLATGKVEKSLEGHRAKVTSLAFSQDGSKIVSGSHDGTAKVWYAASGRDILTLDGNKVVVTAVAIRHDGAQLVTAHADNTLKMWNAISGEMSLTLIGHTKPVRCVAFSPDGRRIVSGGDDTTIRVWDSVTGNETLTLREHTDAVTSVVFSLDGKQVISGSKDRTIRVWDGSKRKKDEGRK